MALPALDVDAVLRGQALDPAAVRTNSPRLVEAAEHARSCAAALVEPQVVRARHRVRSVHEDIAVIGDGQRLTGKAMTRWLEGAELVEAAVCTIGPRLERHASDELERNPVLAMALDGAGNAALRSLSALVCADIAESAAGRGWRQGTPLSPGCCGWPFERGQRELFRLVDAGAIGVELLESAMMRPIKSISMIVGLGPTINRLENGCEICELRGRCRHAATDPRETAGGTMERGTECDRR